ncbi:MAG: 50S ribosomal protein L4 [Deltaproteobacteria bacterium]|nr:50S ribosomal protein L4 [Deltaproteobacteria bacterium]
MKNITVRNQRNEKIGTVVLHDVFREINKPEFAVQRAVVTELSNARKSMRFFKNRTLVSGGGIKPWRQKGTGRARQGSIRAPQWVGGGDAFGGKHTLFNKKMNKSERRRAMRAALSILCAQNKIFIFDKLYFEKPSTKEAVAILKNFGISKALIVVQRDDNISLSFRNINGVKLSTLSGVTVFDLMKYENLMLTTTDWEALSQRVAKDVKKKNEASS